MMCSGVYEIVRGAELWKSRRAFEECATVPGRRSAGFKDADPHVTIGMDGRIPGEQPRIAA